MNFMNKNNKIPISRANTGKLLDWSNHFFPFEFGFKNFTFWSRAEKYSHNTLIF